MMQRVAATTVQSPYQIRPVMTRNTAPRVTPIRMLSNCARRIARIIASSSARTIARPPDGENVLHRARADRVHALRRLVHEEQFGVVDERGGHRYPLAHAFGVLADDLAIGLKLEEIEQSAGAFDRGGPLESVHTPD